MWDWEEMQKIAYGQMGLKPDEFWNMSPREFVLMLRGYKEKQEREFDLWALSAYYSTNSMFWKKPITLNAIMGKKQTPHASIVDRQNVVEEIRKVTKERMCQGGGKSNRFFSD
jgi:hypothetical protein